MRVFTCEFHQNNYHGLNSKRFVLTLQKFK